MRRCTWIGGEVFVAVSELGEAFAVGVANVEVGEPSSNMFSMSYSSSRRAVMVKSVPEPDSGGWLKVLARSAPMADRCEEVNVSDEGILCSFRAS